MDKFSSYLYSILAWTLAFILFAFFRFYGIDEIPDVQMRAHPMERIPLPAFLFIGTLTGLTYEFIERRAETRKFLQNRPYWITLVFKTFIYGLLSQALIIMVGIIASWRQTRQLNWETIWGVAGGKNFWVFYGFVSLIALAMAVFKIISQHFGPRTLLNLLIGKYYRPFEEYRIFMFLDMRDSTTIAEQLGTIQYSQFIQSCFRDFSGVIQQHRPEVYQYVGDEVVLTWLPQWGLDNFNCLRACFTFNRLLQERASFYEEMYGVIPTFKAGVHIGRVRVTEIGTIRRAIAYHGDVMNTTARIQSQCNSLGHELLISEELLKELPRKNEWFEYEHFEAVALKGKEQRVNLVGVREIIAAPASMNTFSQ